MRRQTPWHYSLIHDTSFSSRKRHFYTFLLPMWNLRLISMQLCSLAHWSANPGQRFQGDYYCHTRECAIHVDRCACWAVAAECVVASDFFCCCILPIFFKEYLSEFQLGISLASRESGSSCGHHASWDQSRRSQYRGRIRRVRIMKHSHPLDQTNLKKGFKHVGIQ